MAATIPEPEARPALQYECCTVRYLLGPWVQDLLDLAEVQPGQRVLDLACGTGAVAQVAAVRAGPEQ
jgi:predicted RNA methylase